MFDAKIPRGLFHGEETHVRDAQTYGAKSVLIRKYALSAKDFANRRSGLPHMVDEAEKAWKRTKSKVSAKVEP
jgi:hypothetical protein